MSWVYRKASTGVKRKLEGTRCKHWTLCNFTEYWPWMSVIECTRLLGEEERKKQVLPLKKEPWGKIKEITYVNGNILEIVLLCLDVISVRIFAQVLAKIFIMATKPVKNITMDYGDSQGGCPRLLDGSLAIFKDNIVWFPERTFCLLCLPKFFLNLNCLAIHSLEVQAKKQITFKWTLCIWFSKLMTWSYFTDLTFLSLSVDQTYIQFFTQLLT